jgi:hypothetical protein
MLIAGIGQRLAHKPFEWMSWWWQIKWEAFIDIYPQLSEENPLWQRENSHLENIRLCGLPPDELQEEIAVYWQKSFWRRWLLSFFTDIDNKIVIWSYYKRCLSFRIIHKENPALEQRLMVYDPEQRLVNQLLHKLKQDTDVLESSLEKYTGNAKWIEKNLSELLAKHEKKRQRFFLKLLKKYLKELPAESNHEFIRKKLEEEYQELEKILRNYVKNSCQANLSEQEFLPSIEENPNRDLVYVGPAVTEEKESSYLDSDLSCSMSPTNEWLALKRQSIKELLKEEPIPYDTIQSLLEKSLQSLRLLIEPQLDGYERVVNEVRYKRTNHKEALKWSEFLQNRLAYFFRQSGLLFHPDKSDGNENLRVIKTELFKEFQQFAETSLERLSIGLKTLKRCIPQWEVDLDKMLEETESDRKEFRAWFDQKFAKMEAESAQLRAESAQLRAESARSKEESARSKAESAQARAESAEMKKKQVRMEKQLNALMRQMGVNTFYSEEQEQLLEHSLPQP